eukprot:TRINITY_DN7067_c0_g1_i1.p1 TRINITY_DN7067_c0_g1~~TRINITY_DN7067_c0_g1_i1.p1  ORF type:complete len:303 (-),score=66.41 TRINITY_DN7067_c0_g1_i1:119-1027(-)
MPIPTMKGSKPSPQRVVRALEYCEIVLGPIRVEQTIPPAIPAKRLTSAFFRSSTDAFGLVATAWRKCPAGGGAAIAAPRNTSKLSVNSLVLIQFGRHFWLICCAPRLMSTKKRELPKRRARANAVKNMSKLVPATRRTKNVVKTAKEPLRVKYTLSEDGQTMMLDREYVKVGEDDPAIVIHWFEDSLAGFLGAAMAAPPPAGHFLHAVATNPNASVDDLKNALVSRLAGIAGGIVCSTIIGPNTISQYSNARTTLWGLGFDPFIVGIGIAGLGSLYRIDDRKQATTGVRDALVGGAFVQIFD